jgi:ketosteroid isomerase-like protein
MIKTNRSLKLLLVGALALGGAGLAAIANGKANAQTQASSIIAEAEDRIQITDLLYRHQMYIDLSDADRYADIYASDGVYQSPFASATGHEEILAMFRKLAASGFTKGKRHFTGPIMIQVNGDRATAASYWWVADYSGAQSAVFATGTYQDDLRKINGTWKIQKRIQTLDANGQKEGNSALK